MRWLPLVLVAGIALCSTSGAAAATTSYDANGTFVVNGSRGFPIVLSDPPPRTGTTPSGGNALGEIASAGVTFVRVGPNGVPWSDTEVADAQAWDQAVAPYGMATWIKLRELATAQPGTASAAMLKKVVTTLEGDAGFGLWKGYDEPWWSGIQPSQLQYAYCMATSRGSLSWCGPDSPLDSNHVFVTIEAPRGTASDLQPYSAVTDSHGVDIYPVTYGLDNPNLHQVGTWTQTMSSITPNHVVWTTLQICDSGSIPNDGSDGYVLPTRLQERYMIYDAIINGARALAFFGGQVNYCWTSTDSSLGWNWTFWNTVLKSLIQEISAGSPLAPALVNSGTTQTLLSSDATTEVISRQGATSNDLWVVAARSGAGTQNVTISGLPANVTSGSAYTEGRSVAVSNGSFTDSFGQWAVHVYHFTTGGSSSPAPTINSFTPTSGPAGTAVTISGANFTGATAVAFNGASASYTVNSDSQITVTVPNGASTGPITVTTASGAATSASNFSVTSPDFTLSAAPASQSIIRGASTTYTVTITPSNGFSSAVTLSVAGLPAGATASFAPNPASNTSTLTIQTVATTKVGGYTLTITGTSGSLTHTATVTLQVRRK
jgi:hypothetical protein